MTDIQSNVNDRYCNAFYIINDSLFLTRVLFHVEIRSNCSGSLINQVSADKTENRIVYFGLIKKHVLVRF